jgi:hypothetical protein
VAATLLSAWALAFSPEARAQVAPSANPAQGIACAFNSSPPTVASGTAVWIQCDSSGHLAISGAIAISNGSINTIPTQSSSTQTSGTTSATPSTFTQVLASNSNRLACLVQNKSASVERIYLGTTGSATSAAAFLLQPNDTFSCTQGGTIAADAIQINSDTASQAYSVVTR